MAGSGARCHGILVGGPHRAGAGREEWAYAEDAGSRPRVVSLVLALGDRHRAGQRRDRGGQGEGRRRGRRGRRRPEGRQRAGGQGDRRPAGGPQACCPPRAAELADAREAATAAEEADRAAQAELDQATAAAIRAEQERAEVEFQIQDLQSRVGNLAREVYQNGAFADFDLLITASSAYRAGRSRRRRSTRCRGPTTARWRRWPGCAPSSALKEARLEVLRQQVDEKRQLAAIALSKANIARDRAAAAKLKVDLLVAQKAAALDVAAAERAGVLKQYKSVQAEQERIAALLATQAAAEAARLAGGGSLASRPRVRTASGGPWTPRSGSGRASARASTPCTATGPATRASTRAHPPARRSWRRRRDRGRQRHRWSVRQPHADLARQRDLLDVRPPVAVRRRKEGQTVKPGEVIGFVGQHRATRPVRTCTSRSTSAPSPTTRWAGSVARRSRSAADAARAGAPPGGPEQEGAPRLPHRGDVRGRASCWSAPRSSRCAPGGPASSTRSRSSADGELFLHGLHIPEYAQGTWTNHAPRRVRKLLLQAGRARTGWSARSRRAGSRSCRWRCTSRTATPRWRSAWPRQEVLRQAADMAERDAKRDIAKAMAGTSRAGQACRRLSGAWRGHDLARTRACGYLTGCRGPWSVSRFAGDNSTGGDRFRRRM